MSGFTSPHLSLSTRLPTDPLSFVLQRRKVYQAFAQSNIQHLVSPVCHHIVRRSNNQTCLCPYWSTDEEYVDNSRLSGSDSYVFLSLRSITR
jgi:hypothetical protein